MSSSSSLIVQETRPHVDFDEEEHVSLMVTACGISKRDLKVLFDGEQMLRTGEPRSFMNPVVHKTMEWFGRKCGQMSQFLKETQWSGRYAAASISMHFLLA